MEGKLEEGRTEEDEGRRAERERLSKLLKGNEGHGARVTNLSEPRFGLVARCSV